MKIKKTEKVETYSSQSFREKFLGSKNPMHLLFKTNSDHFFCLKLQEMMQLQHPVPPSKHNCHTLIFITSGTHIMKLGYEEYYTNTNEIIVVPAGHIFSIEHVNSKHTGFICQFHPDLLIGKYGNRDMLNDFDFLKIFGNPKIIVPEKDTVFINNILTRLETAYLENDKTDLDLTQSYLMALFFEMNKNAVKSRQSGTASIILATRFKELIYANIKTNSQVNYYASLLNITPNHLNKSVKLVTGKSATRWIDETILLEAKYLLFQTTLSVSEIAMKVGHEDQSYFSRFFKKHEGISPIQYRKLIGKC